MYEPSGVSVNPPVSIEFRGIRLKCNSARDGLKTLRAAGAAPETEQDFLAELARIAPVLVRGGAPGLSVRLWQAIAYLKALKGRWSEAEPFVSLEQARARAAICEDCEFRTPISGCSECRGFASHLMQVPEGLGHDLGGCGKCGCVLNVKVWLSPEVLAGDPREIAFPPWCWNQSSVGSSSE